MCPLRRLIGGTAEAEPLYSCSDHHACVRTRSRSRFFVVFFLSKCIIGWAMQIERLLDKVLGRRFFSELLIWAGQRRWKAWSTYSSSLEDGELWFGRIFPIDWTVRATRWEWRQPVSNSLHVLLGLGVRGTRAGERRSLASKLNKLRKKKKQTIQGTNKYCKMEIQLSNEHIVLTALDTSRFYSFY